MHPFAESLVRMEVSKARGQAQLLDDKLKLVPASSLDDGAARTLVDDAASIIATFTNIIACLSRNPHASPVDPGGHRSKPAITTTSETSHSDEDHTPTKKRKLKNQHQQQPHSIEHELVPDDGYTWRKYGQKDILGSRHPKSYYRCTHKRESGCPAIKYVQRSDSNPSSFQITYRGEHTCNMLRSSPLGSPSPPSPALAMPMVNSVCLRINSDGGLQIGASGPTVIPSLPLDVSPNHTPPPPRNTGASAPSHGIGQRDLEATRGQLITQELDDASSSVVKVEGEIDVCGGMTLESMLEFGSSVLDSLELNGCQLFPSDHSSPEWSDCIAY
ncbi:probable WRKY transcription factor 41 [Selaginella moellendorffii]|nr:probable WRKY transcription factor 41 [Selaginella moellendorffii]|eukprot:XP_002965010.2 probable WRKY transcription factor 41 [Selaginella moellendorffii]